MTLGWILEDAWEAFLESTDRLPPLPPPGPEPKPCPFCNLNFSSPSELHTHLAAAHRGERPVLLLAGMEPDRTTRVVERIKRGDIVVENCTAVRARVDGAPEELMGSAAVSRLLAGVSDATVLLVLENSFEPNAAAITQTYTLVVRAPEKSRLDAVDRAFLAHLATGRAGLDAVTSFLSDGRCQGVANDYADALAAYVRGTLVKDHPVDGGITLPAAQARNLYGDALFRLKAHDRPLARLICGLIRFAFNDLAEITHTGFDRLDAVAERLAGLAGRRAACPMRARTPRGAKTIGICPIDHGVSRVLDLAEHLAAQRRWGPALREECSQSANSETLDTEDRRKILALWANAALTLGATREAEEPLRSIGGSYPFGVWAERALEKIER